MSKTFSGGVEVRRHIVDALYADLVGPHTGRKAHTSSAELLDVPPSRFYLMGFLAPLGDRDTEDPTSDEELDAGDDLDDDENNSDASSNEPKRRKMLPASLGLSVLLPAGDLSDVVTVRLDYATYARVPSPLAAPKAKGRKKQVWKREPRETTVMTVALRDVAEVIVPNANSLRIRGRVTDVVAPERQGLPAGTRALSLFVVNEQPEGDRGHRDERFLFQVSLEVEFAKGLVRRPNRQGEGSHQKDDAIADLQFRNHFEYAVGHNVSVVIPEGQKVVTKARTAWLPTAEVKKVRAPLVDGVQVEMGKLAKLSDARSVRAALGELPNAYARWIEDRRKVPLGVSSPSREETRTGVLDNAEIAKQRIERGIEILCDDKAALRAFTWMNSALAHQTHQRNRNNPNAWVPAWRLFQLAFVLLSVESTVNPQSQDRDLVDLIFFPTGGGKTEAYLGLIGFTLLLRRLRGRARPDQGLGVAVILRYTLRLLTLDQLGRASALVCALELLRRDNPEALGDVRFSVGLWVGQSASPNKLSVLKEKLDKFKLQGSGLPFPLANCPWCGDEIVGDCFKLTPRSKPSSVTVCCTNFEECEFNQGDGLPIVFVDEQVYRELPSFLIGTVDKFALMPWNGRIGMLFGRATSRDKTGHKNGATVATFYGPMDERVGALALRDQLLRPELIVQDELHLISGPLGTMVGLYETVVDALCATTPDGEPGPRAKIVASTATVRRAEYQVGALYGRRVAVFPPPGIDENETFFSEVDTKAPRRLYVGVAAPGRALKQVVLRSYVSALSSAKYAYDRASNKDAADGYLTIVGYFNALRILGGVRRLVEDQVRTYAARWARRRPLDAVGENQWFADRQIGIPVELTSRESTDRIAGTKARLERPHNESNLDVLLASNMISVGVDIDRLGLMVVAGQPKTTAEYIQASSRVGRDATKPGLVITALNVVKPRDRSHYERFSAYHESFYRFVEAPSVTPFSKPALERGLAGAVLGLARLMHPAMTAKHAVMDIVEQRVAIEKGVECFSIKAARVESKASETTRRTLNAEVRTVLRRWERLVSDAKAATARRVYSPHEKSKDAKPVLRDALTKDDAKGTEAERFVAPTSMRDVEQAAHVWVTATLPASWKKDFAKKKREGKA